MDVKIIESLIEAFNKAELTKFSLKCKDFELKLCKDNHSFSNPQTMIPSVHVVTTPMNTTPIAETPKMPPDGPILQDQDEATQ